MLLRDLDRLHGADRRVDRSPLGAGALAGVTFPVDREGVAAELGFTAPVANSLDAVSDRDFVLDLLFACATIAIHLSRLSEEIILWASAEFQFIELSDAFSTGSSIMPQKKNPDVAELARGKSGRVVGQLVAMLTIVKATPLAYNKDFQEDKAALFDAVDTVLAVLDIYPPMLRTARFRRERLADAAAADFSLATDAADLLARRDTRSSAAWSPSAWRPARRSPISRRPSGPPCIRSSPASNLPFPPPRASRRAMCRAAPLRIASRAPCWSREGRRRRGAPGSISVRISTRR
jgi:argininosuccinate lyase